MGWWCIGNIPPSPEHLFIEIGALLRGENEVQVLNSPQGSIKKSAQQSVHLTLGILRTLQAVSYALSFFWSDGFAVPAPAQVTQTVRCFA